MPHYEDAIKASMLRVFFSSFVSYISKFLGSYVFLGQK